MDAVDWALPRRETGWAIGAGVLLLGGAFVAAPYTASIEGLFAPVPRVAPGVSIPPLDIVPAGKLAVFHATIYTVWATMLLSLPAFCTVWFIRGSKRAGAYWLAFWSVGLVAMLVHQYLAMGLLFEWSWQHILHDTVRVTIPIPDLVLTVWWTVDVALGWWLLHGRGLLVHAQRLCLHIALLVIFLIGFIKEGEIGVSKAIGIGSALTVLAALVLMRTRRPTSPVAT